MLTISMRTMIAGIVTLLIVAIQLRQVIAAESCTYDALAGTYQTGYGQMICEAADESLSCCYGPKCLNRVELRFGDGGGVLDGHWIYPNGTSGAAMFSVAAACAVGDGRWGRSSDRMTGSWAVRGRVNDGRAEVTRSAREQVRRDERERRTPGTQSGATRTRAGQSRTARTETRSQPFTTGATPDTNADADIVLEGTYDCRVGTIGTRIELDRGDGGSVTGTVSSLPLDPASAPGAARTFQSYQYRVSGTIHPLTHVVELTAGSWVTPAAGTALDLQGIFLEREGVLAARLMQRNRPASQCTTLIASRDGLAHIRPGPEVSSAADATVPKCESLIQWASRVKSEYPAGNFGNTEVMVLADRAQPLYHDDAFVPVFGAPFEHVVGSRGRDISRRINECKQQNRGVDALHAIRPDPFMQPRGLQGSVATLSGIWRHRAVQRWQDNQLDAIDKLPSSPAAFAQIRTIRSAASEVLGMEWPSTRQSFSDAASITLSRVAEDLLNVEFDRMASLEPDISVARDVLALLTGREPVSNSMPSIDMNDPASIRAYREQARAQIRAADGSIGAGLMSELKDSTRGRVKERGRQLLEEILRSTTTVHAAEIKAFPQGIAGLDASWQWWSRMASMYRPFGTAPPIGSLRTKVEVFRQVVFAHAKDELSNRIRSATDYNDLETILRRTFLFDQERQTETGTAILATARDRRASLDREAYLALYSERERQLMGDGNNLQVSANYGEPVADEVVLATIREIAGLWGERKGARSATVGTGPFSAFIRFDFSLLDARVESCQKNRTGYQCRYTVTPFLALEGTAQDQMADDIRTLGLQFLIAALNAGPVTLTDQFELTSRGWRSSSIRVRYGVGLLNGLSATAEGVSKGLAGEACLAGALSGDWDPDC